MDNAEMGVMHNEGMSAMDNAGMCAMDNVGASACVNAVLKGGVGITTMRGVCPVAISPVGAYRPLKALRPTGVYAGPMSDVKCGD